MLKKDEIIIYHMGMAGHVSQFYTGLLNLKDEYKVIKHKDIKYSNDAIISFYYKEKLITCDFNDGYQFLDCANYKWIEKSDFYFKRSYSKKINNQFLSAYSYKIFPLCLNYFVTKFFSPYTFSFGKNRTKLFLKILLGLDCIVTENIFEKKQSRFSNNGRILFLTRVWDPETQHCEVERINKTRIELIRKCRAVFGERFFGGVSSDKFSKNLCPDLILSRKITCKKNFLRLLGKFDICITTDGLHNSIGWKFAEYIASGKVVLAETLKYEVPNLNHKDTINYIPFTDTNECISKINDLLKKPDLCLTIHKNNIAYYNSYIKAHRVVLNVLEKIDEKIK